MSEFSIRTKTFRLGQADYRALWLTDVGHALMNPLFCLSLLAPTLAVGLNHVDIRIYVCVQAAWLGLFIAFIVFTGVSRWQQQRRNPVMTGERIMLINDRAVRLVGDGFDTRLAWSRFSGVRRGRNHLFIYMTGRAAYILPRSAFAAPDDMKRLAEAAGDAMRAARKAPAPLPPLPEAPDSREIWRSLPYGGGWEIGFTRDYVRCTGATFDSRSDWGNVRKVDRNRGRIVFHLLSGRFSVPASAFATPAQAMAFYTQAVAFWRAAEARR